MTSPDFAAAQERVLARRQQRAAAARAHQEELRSTQAAHRLSRLPGPLGDILGRKSVEAWDRIKGRRGTRPAYRVGQVDAELLDEELLSLLKAQVGEGLKGFGAYASQDWSAEILLALRAVLFKLSVWDHDATYGAALQGLRYADARHDGPVPRAPSYAQKGLYGLITVAGRYAWSRWEDWLLDKEEEPTTRRRVRLLSRLFSFLSSAHDIAALLSFLVFLVNGRYRTLLDRVLRLRLVTPNNQVGREVSFEYLNRQLVWHAFTEFLLFLLPLVGIGRWRRWLARAWRRAKELAQGDEEEEGNRTDGELGFLPERTCAICYQQQNPAAMSETEAMAIGAAASGTGTGVIGSVQTDVTNPYEAIPCGCVYCFVCVATRLQAEEGEGFVCLKCGAYVKECRPWAGDVVTYRHRRRPSGSGNAKSVSFADEPAGKEDDDEDDNDNESEDEAAMAFIDPMQDSEFQELSRSEMDYGKT